MDPERSMRPTYRHADLLGLSGLFRVSVCVNNTGGENETCCRRWEGGDCPVVLSSQ